MANLTKDAILSASDIPAPERITVPEWGGDVYVRTMTGEERDSYITAVFGTSGKERNMRNATAQLLARTLCDEKGNRIFSDGDAAALGRKSSAVLGPLFAAASRLNGLSKADMEEIVGNSEAGLTAGSS